MRRCSARLGVSVAFGNLLTQSPTLVRSAQSLMLCADAKKRVLKQRPSFRLPENILISG